MRRLLLASLALLTACGSPSAGNEGADPGERTTTPSPSQTTSGTSAGTWTRLPAPPLSPRQRPAGAYVNGEVVFVGGYTGPPCPPNADCAYPDEHASDGAAYDVESGTWRRIADAPRPVRAFALTAVVDDRLYVLSDEHLLAWDGSDDSWAEIETPRLRWTGLVADGPWLVFASGSDENGVRPDPVLDTRSGEWSTLPEDPLGPSFDRVVTPTDAGLVLTAKRIEPDGGPADPALVMAALLPPGGTTWSRLPDADQLGGWRWAWTGQRLVDPTLGGADGGEVNNFGRTIPYGGRLDPAAGTWSPLPRTPEEHTGGWPVEAVSGGGPVMAAEGWLYDDARGSWTRLPRPTDAPEQPGTAVWADGLLVVLGGDDWADISGSDDWTSANVYARDAWAYRP